MTFVYAALGAFIGAMLSRKWRERRQRRRALAMVKSYDRKVNAADWMAIETVPAPVQWVEPSRVEINSNPLPPMKEDSQ